LPPAEVDRLGRAARRGGLRRHDDHHERALVPGARADRVLRPRVALAVVALELGLDDRAEHRPVIDEQDHGVGVVLGRRDLGERGIGQPRLGERRHLGAEQLGQQIGDKLRTAADQLEHTFMKYGRHGDTCAACTARL
jgi:hypothetical protein